MIANSRIALTLSVLFFVAVPISPSAHGQATPTTKNNHYWCAGSTPFGIANSGPRFTVKVFALVSTDIYGQFHHERPVGGATVVLSEMGHEISAVTDTQGIAEFSDVPSGAYRVYIEGARFWEAQASLTVDAENGTPTEIGLIWPQRAYVVRQVRGWLMDSFTNVEWSTEPNYKPRPFVEAQVRLMDLSSGASVASTKTDDKGYYEFPSVAPGFYLVRFKEDSDSPNFNMAAEVDEKADREHLPTLSAEKHDCGPGLRNY